jgi:hypothetical protein
MRKPFVAALSFAVAVLCTGVPAGAQNVEMPAAPAATEQATSLPSRGQSMARVESRFGAPSQRHAAVGQPPITRWVYPTFVVYFEYEHVIHTVAIRQ